MRLSGSNRQSCPVRSLKMSATGSGACGPGPGPASGAGSGASNPRKFSEKIALHTQRQAEETAAFQEVMMDITSTRVSLGRAARRQAGPARACWASAHRYLPTLLGLLSGTDGLVVTAAERRQSVGLLSAGFISETSLAQLANISMPS